ncbi:hypothetical protein D3C81_881330 [compost metagenome]
MTRVPRGVDAQQFTSGQQNAMTILGHHHTLGRHRHDLSVTARDFRFAVHRSGAGNQPGRVDHVLRAARVHHQPGVGQLLHQRTGAACMIQMHMGNDQPINIRRLQTRLPYAGQQVGQRMAGTAVDEGAASVLHDEIGRIEMIALERGIDGVDAMRNGHRCSSLMVSLRS